MYELFVGNQPSGANRSALIGINLTKWSWIRRRGEVNGEHVQAEADACRILMEGWNLAYHIPLLAERKAQQQAHSLASLSRLLRAGIEAGEFRTDMEVETQARILMATLHGLMVQWHRQPGSVDWHAVAQEFIRGLRPC